MKLSELVYEAQNRTIILTVKYTFEIIDPTDGFVETGV